MIVRLKASIFKGFGYSYSGTATAMIPENTFYRVSYDMNTENHMYLEPVGGGESFILPLEVFKLITEEIKEGV